ncbi:hypothetical protein OC834_004667 [Tilletia horrida]|nr:hypothetical protein OC834_004667 [Tilletia horrida]
MGDYDGFQPPSGSSAEMTSAGTPALGYTSFTSSSSYSHPSSSSYPRPSPSSRYALGPDQWTRDDIVRIPHHLFMLHPEAQRMNQEVLGLKARVTSLEATNAQLATSAAQLSALAAQSTVTGNGPRNISSSGPRTYNSASSYEDQDGRIIIDGEDLSCVPERPLEKLPGADVMCWTQAHAQRLHLNSQYGKQEVTREASGDVIEDDVEAEIEKDVRFSCAVLDDIKMPDYLKKKTRTFELYTTYYLPDLLRICIKLEHRWPQLSYCTYHYKALKWIQKHLKAKVGTVAKAKRKDGKDSEARPVKRRRTTQSESQLEASAQDKGKQKEKTPHLPSPARRARRTPAPAPKARQQQDSDSSMSEDECSDDVTIRKAGAFTSSVGSLLSSALYEERATPDASSSHAGESMLIIERPPSPGTQVEHGSKAPVPPVALSRQAMGTTLAAMRASDVGELAAPRTGTLASLLTSRYKALQDDAKKEARAALEVLETAAEEGLDPDKDPSPNFLAWLKRLEDAQPNYQDEDQCGPSFGHDELGTWVYHSPLQKRKTYGSIENACRLLAALLRIWAIAKDDCDKMRSKFQPTVQSSIERISGYICTAFNPEPTSSPGPAKSASAIEIDDSDDEQQPPRMQSLAAAVLEETQTQSVNAYSQAESFTSTTTKARARGAVLLRKGIKLNKAQIKKALELGKKNHDTSSSKDALLTLLIKSVDDGSIVLTAQQYKCLSTDMEVPDAHKIRGVRNNNT